MRLLILLPSLLLFAQLLQAQCCPYVEPMAFIPEFPMAGDEVFVITNVTTPNQGAYLGYDLEVVNDTIVIEACYFNGFATAIQTYIDTISLGIVEDGELNVHFIANQSINPDNCVIEDTQTIDASIDVLPLSIQENEAIDLKIFPSPAQDNLTVQSSLSFDQITIHDFTGKICHQRTLSATKQTKLDVRLLNSGIYFLQLADGGRILTMRRIAII